jgi:hypothetical protein
VTRVAEPLLGPLVVRPNVDDLDFARVAARGEVGDADRDWSVLLHRQGNYRPPNLLRLLSPMKRGI